ncbi:MAG: shikimate dehydrogenase [Bryobacterales bacterium]|nr:shikimate dehydrogenase [Bryobacteraceae bacterium]MDW8355029.1 shikimate dehydrogenase [Bryobacterales bacterium]
MLRQLARASSICVSLGCPTPQRLLDQACREAELGEDFFEFRLDLLDEPQHGPRVIREFLARHPECTLMATCRRREAGGQFDGGVAQQLEILEAAVEAGARFVDLEIESAAHVGDRLPSLGARLVVSYHNFSATPALETVLRRLRKIPAAAYKIATTARKPSDWFRVLSLLRNHRDVGLIALAMGDTGAPSRVLGPTFGALFTYAAPRSGDGTAPGQLNAVELRKLYRLGKLSRTSRIYGVIADPVSHSLSPVVHNRAFEVRRFDAVYLPFRVQPPHLRDFMTVATKLPIAGFSVTIPHKQRILRYLDAVDPLARRIGAVNTVWRKSGRWRGANADVDGVLAPLKRRMRLSGASVLVAGSGGAARSAAFALADAGARVSITGRTPARVQALARACGGEALTPETVREREFDVLIHATPLGMFPHTDQCFFPDRIPAALVFDMVYNPAETLLIRRAREQGKEVICGLEMFLEQAARQFEIWTGETAPRSVMARAAEEALART